MIRNWGKSLDVEEDFPPCRGECRDLAWSEGEGFRLESRFSEGEFDRLDLDDLLDLVSEERMLADEFLIPSSFTACLDLQ